MIRVNAYPSQRFTGKVAFVYPTLNSDTRTVQVRIELANPDGKLKPGMYAEQLPINGNWCGTVQWSPESALIDSGHRQVVLIDKGRPEYVPRR